ncbi:hypothetical protein DH2020_042849 [Rehmannia glutinosa]|uniref:Uncharacterized protein n=1 Tax=Rehmannia glutinosa TaxID=99300 RepID=A0ABR0UN70_REHGL
MSKKRKLGEFETVKLTEECNAILQRKLPQKLKDPGSFTIPCTIGASIFNKALCDLGASINLMPLSVFRKLGLGEVKPSTITLQLADRSLTYPRGIIEDVLVKVDKFIFPADFVVLDMEEDREVPLILGRPFLATGRALIDVQRGELTLRVNEEEVMFNIYNAMKFQEEQHTCHFIDLAEQCARSEIAQHIIVDPLEKCLTQSLVQGMEYDFDDIDLLDYVLSLDATQVDTSKWSKESLGDTIIEEIPKVTPELKELPTHLRYAFLRENDTHLVIVSASLSPSELDKLLHILRKHKSALGWSIADLKGISPSIVMHKILMEDSYKPSIEHQRRLNPKNERSSQN